MTPSTSTFNALTIAADKEEVLGNPDKVQKQIRDDFWQFQRDLSGVSTRTKDYAAAYTHLGLDPTQPILRKVLLYPWQVVAVSWIASMEALWLRGEICGYDMDLGKTVISLALIDWSAEHAEEEAIHKPTLIAAPSVAIGVWKSELRKLFPHFHVWLYLRDAEPETVTPGTRTLSRDPFKMATDTAELDKSLGLEEVLGTQ